MNRKELNEIQHLLEEKDKLTAFMARKPTEMSITVADRNPNGAHGSVNRYAYYASLPLQEGVVEACRTELRRLENRLSTLGFKE